MSKDKKINCNFCGKSAKEVDKVIAGPAEYICNECVDLCKDIVDDEDIGALVMSLFKDSLTKGEQRRLEAYAEMRRTKAYIDQLEENKRREDKKFKDYRDRAYDSQAQWLQHAHRIECCFIFMCVVMLGLSACIVVAFFKLLGYG